LVTDASFNLLYGTTRSRLKQLEISFQLRRRVLMVQVSESAGPDGIAIAVKSASPAPYSAVFPYRYMAAARYYLGENPGTPVLRIGGRVRGFPAEDGLSVFYTDTAVDFYRAGLCAALFAGEGGGTVLFFQDNSVSQSDRDAFSSGLGQGGFEGRPVFLSLTSDYSAWQNVSCALATGSASRLFEQGIKMPVLLFSWIDPKFVPGNVMVLFDDSPWALTLRAVRAVEKGEKGGLLSSEMVLPPRLALGKENTVQLKLASKASREEP
jgi:hypothetical protein